MDSLCSNMLSFLFEGCLGLLLYKDKTDTNSNSEMITDITVDRKGISALNARNVQADQQKIRLAPLDISGCT